MNRHTFATALLLAAGLALTGCGGGDSATEADVSGDQQDTIVSDDQESAIPNHGELHVKADAAREYIQDNLGGSCTELSPVEDADANGDETSTCSTDYGSIIIMSSSSIDDTHYYLMNTMGANLDAWEEQGVFFIAAPDVLELIQ